eukprot:403357005
MSLKELQNYPIFKADRNRIYQEAIDLAVDKTNQQYTSKMRSKNGIKANESKQQKLIDPLIIEFRVHYVTNFGQEVYQVGSDQNLGNWKGDGAQKMKWNHGHLWTAQYQRDKLSPSFEFKFIIKEGNNIARWEEGQNHTYNLENLMKKFEQPEIMRQLENGKFDEIEIAFDKEKISYNKLNRLFALHTLWQSH